MEKTNITAMDTLFEECQEKIKKIIALLNEKDLKNDPKRQEVLRLFADLHKQVVMFLGDSSQSSYIENRSMKALLTQIEHLSRYFSRLSNIVSIGIMSEKITRYKRDRKIRDAEWKEMERDLENLGHPKEKITIN